MANDKSAQVLEGDQLALAVKSLGGNMLASGGAIDPTCLVDFQGEKQLAYKTFLVGGSGSTGLIKVVSSLPVVGEEGFLYGVLRPELDREGYGIIEFFVWYNNEWLATGAYSIDIDPNGLVYEDNIPYATATKVGGIKQTFDATTGTWTVTTDNI